MTVKIAVAEPMPTANATTARSATPGAVFHDAQACEKADSTAPRLYRERHGATTAASRAAIATWCC
jgi:hypothetical protein